MATKAEREREIARAVKRSTRSSALLEGRVVPSGYKPSAGVSVILKERKEKS